MYACSQATFLLFQNSLYLPIYAAQEQKQENLDCLLTSPTEVKEVSHFHSVRDLHEVFLPQ